MQRRKASTLVPIALSFKETSPWNTKLHDGITALQFQSAHSAPKTALKLQCIYLLCAKFSGDWDRADILRCQDAGFWGEVKSLLPGVLVLCRCAQPLSHAPHL